MKPLAAGTIAPSIREVDFAAGPTVLFFYKVTCPVCQMAAPKVSTFETAYPGRIVGIGQDPPDKLAAFDRAYGLGFPARPDAPPYDLSRAYGIRTVPTTFLVDRERTILESVESWDRDRLNGVSRRLAELTGAAFAPISRPGDGLPTFRPG